MTERGREPREEAPRMAIEAADAVALKAGGCAGQGRVGLGSRCREREGRRVPCGHSWGWGRAGGAVLLRLRSEQEECRRSGEAEGFWLGFGMRERGVPQRAGTWLYMEREGAADFMGWAKCGLLRGCGEPMGHRAATGPAVEERAMPCRPRHGLLLRAGPKYRASCRAHGPRLHAQL
jgi:hypothetical protein